MSELNTEKLNEYDNQTLFENNENLKPLTDLIHSVIEIDENSLNEQIISSTIDTINATLNSRIKQTAIDGLIRSFAEANCDFEQAKQLVDSLKSETLKYVSSFVLTKNKKILLDEILKIFFKIFDQGLDEYAGYSFSLPIKVEDGGKAPTYAHSTDAAADIYAAEDYELAPHSLSNKIKTNIKIALPEGWAAAILPRSSIGAKTGLRLSNSVGIIDSDYRGEIGILYDNISDSAYTIKAGDRIAQMIIFPVHHFKVKEVDTLEDTERGEGGFGSSGK